MPRASTRVFAWPPSLATCARDAALMANRLHIHPKELGRNPLTSAPA
jgi:hypothetical protein